MDGTNDKNNNEDRSENYRPSVNTEKDETKKHADDKDEVDEMKGRYYTRFTIFLNIDIDNIA